MSTKPDPRVGLSRGAEPETQFTRADVRRIRDLVAGIEIEFKAGHQFLQFGTAAFLDDWRALAARIEASLENLPVGSPSRGDDANALAVSPRTGISE